MASKRPLPSIFVTWAYSAPQHNTNAIWCSKQSLATLEYFVTIKHAIYGTQVCFSHKALSELSAAAVAALLLALLTNTPLKAGGLAWSL